MDSKDAPVPINSVDWARVHAGELVPPVWVVPLFDDEGLRVLNYGEVLKNDRAAIDRIVTPASAAHYSITGRLLGYRTKDGWRKVSVDDDEGPAPTNQQDVSSKSVGGLTEADERPAPYRPPPHAPVTPYETAADIETRGPTLIPEPEPLLAWYAAQRKAELQYAETGKHPDWWQEYLLGLRRKGDLS